MKRRFVWASAAATCVALPLTFAHCSSIPLYDSVEERVDGNVPPLVEAGGGSVPDAAPTETPDAEPPGCIRPVVDKTPPMADDRCRWATPLAWTTGAIRFGSLDSPVIAVTSRYVFFVMGGQLTRVSRTLWDTPGGDSINPCEAVTLGPVDSDTLQQLLPFDTNGVCVHNLRTGTHTVQCASNEQTALRAVPGLADTDIDGGAFAGPVRQVGAASGFLVWARDRATVEEPAIFYRYGPGDTAPQSMTGQQITNADSLGPFSTTAGHVRASRFCGGCSPDVVDLDVANAVVLKFTIPPPRPKLLSMVRFGDGTFVTLEADLRVMAVRDGQNTELADAGVTLVGPATGEISLALTRQESPDDTEKLQLITSAAPSSASSSWRSHGALVGAHRMVLEGRDLFVASAFLDNCGANQAWIARLPRLLP